FRLRSLPPLHPPIPPLFPYTTLFRSPASGSLGRVRQDRGAEAREPGEVTSDLRRLDAPGIVTHDAEAVVQRNGGAVHARESLQGDRKSTRLNSSHGSISYAVFCLKKK